MSMDEEEHKEIHLILLLDLNTSMEKGKDGSDCHVVKRCDHG